jgi:hypothetical protein
VALVHSTENQIEFVLREVLRTVSLELNRKKCLFSSDTKDDLTGQSSVNSTAGTADNVDAVNTDSDDVLSKLSTSKV